MQMAEGKMERKLSVKMHHMRVTPAKGGVIVSEHAGEHEPPMAKPRVFGKHEGDKLAAHLLKRAGIPGAAEEEGEAEHKDMDEPVEVE